MYVADNGNNRILAFSNGAQTGAWTMGSNGKALNSPWEIALNSAGTTLYVADRNNNRVQVFTAAGVAVTALADPVTTTAAGSVIGVGVDSAGNVYATDAANECVWKFTPGGTVTHWFGSPSAFGLPSGIAVDGSDNVYVMDANAPRVYKFTSDGTPLAYWGSNGSGPGQFEQSYSISAGSCGNLYTSDYGLNRMELFDSNGNFLGQFSGTGSGDGQFSNTYFAAVDGLNDLYVAQNGLGVVQEYSPCGLVCGTPTPTVTPTPTALSCGSTASFTVGEPGGVGLDSTGDLYVANGSASLVGVYTSTGGSVTTVGAGSLQAPMGVALDGNANLYVADQALNEVLVYKNVLSPVNPGSLLAQAGSLGSGNGQLDTPTGLALNSAGTTLYVADMGNSRIEDFQIKTTPAWSLTYAGQWGAWVREGTASSVPRSAWPWTQIPGLFT